MKNEDLLKKRAVTDLQTLREAVVVVLGQLDEEVQQVEGLAGSQGLDSLEAVVGQLVAENSGESRALQLVQLLLPTQQ